VTALGRVLIATSVLACGIIYGTDVFSAIVLRPALALADDQTLVSIRGRVHDFGDRRLRVPGVARLVAAILGTVVIAWAGHLAATVAGAIAVVALACWLIIYARISAPINSAQRPRQGRMFPSRQLRAAVLIWQRLPGSFGARDTSVNGTRTWREARKPRRPDPARR